MPRDHHPALSVVVIGRNEGRRLVRCLASVRTMQPPAGSVELIYVDSGSQDDSPRRAAALGATVVCLGADRPGAAAARNAGLRAARAPYVLFLDGDTVLHQQFASDALAAFDDPAVAVVWGHRREIAPRASLYNRVLDLDWVYPPGPSLFCGGDALMRRAALAAVGGFDETLLAGEEPELCRRLRRRGHVILHVDLPMTGHDLAMTRWVQYWRRATRAGRAYAEVAARTRDGGDPLWDGVARRNRLHAGALLAAPPLAAGAALASAAWWPLVALLAAGAALVARTAWRARWKGGDLATRLFYACHAHLQQIPILCGQLGYARDRRRGGGLRQIEYKAVV